MARRLALLVLVCCSSACSLRQSVRLDSLTGRLDAATPETVPDSTPAERPLLTADDGRVEPTTREGTLVHAAPRARTSIVALAPAEPAPPGPAATTSTATATVALQVTNAGSFEVRSASGRSCTLPCTLSLPAGPNLLSFTGDVTAEHFLDVPPAGGTVRVTFGSRAVRGVKVVLGIIGGLCVVVGLSLSPILGGIPLLILGGVGLVTLLPALLLNASDTFEWAGPGQTASAPRSIPSEIAGGGT